LAYLFASIYGLQVQVSRVFTSGFHPFAISDVPPGRTGIIVMGSGSFTARDWDNNEYSMPDPGAAARVLEAARVYRLANPAFVISSGGKLYEEDPRVPTAVAMRSALIELGVPDEHIV